MGEIYAYFCDKCGYQGPKLYEGYGMFTFRPKRSTTIQKKKSLITKQKDKAIKFFNKIFKPERCPHCNSRHYYKIQIGVWD